MPSSPSICRTRRKSWLPPTMFCMAKSLIFRMRILKKLSSVPLDPWFRVCSVLSATIDVSVATSVSPATHVDVDLDRQSTIDESRGRDIGVGRSLRDDRGRGGIRSTNTFSCLNLYGRIIITLVSPTCIPPWARGLPARYAAAYRRHMRRNPR